MNTAQTPILPVEAMRTSQGYITAAQRTWLKPDELQTLALLQRLADDQMSARMAGWRPRKLPIDESGK